MMADRPPRSDASGYQVGPGMWVRLSYRAFDEDDEPVEPASSELAYVHGMGALLGPLEACLDGQALGAQREVTLQPREAFGPRRREAVVEFSREEFPDDVAPGDHFEAERDQGGRVLLRVLEVHPDAVIVDLNHPLAGQSVRFELEVLEVRPANRQEMEEAEARLQAPPPRLDGLIPAERLLRGPSRRYEMDPSEPGNDGSDDET